MDLTQQRLHAAASAVTSAQRSAAGLQTLLVEDDAGLEALRTTWRKLEERLSQPSAFHSFEWFVAAWQWRRLDARLVLLLATRGTEPAGLLPLVEPVDGGRPTGRLEFLHVPDSQLCEPMIAAEEDAEAVAASLLRGLLALRRAYRIEIPHVPPESRAQAAFVRALKAAGFRVAVAVQAGNPYIALDGSWADYYSGRSRSLKKTCNLAANRLAKAGAVALSHQWQFDGGVPARLIEQVIEVSARSWKVDTGNALDQRGPGAFIRRLSTEAAARGWLSLWLLQVDGRPAAMEYQLIHGTRVHALRADFDEALREAGPGVHLNKALLERLFGSGRHRYLMGPGDNPYKFRWTDASEQLQRLEAYFPGPHGAWAAWLELRLKPWLRRWRDRLRAHSEEQKTDKKTAEGDG